MRSIVPSALRRSLSLFGGVLALALLCSSLVCVPVARAQAGAQRSYIIVNNSSTTIYAIFMKPTSASDWGEDRLGQRVLPQNEALTMRQLNAGLYDIKLVLTEGDECVRRRVPVSANGLWDLTDSELDRCFAQSRRPGHFNYTFVNNSATTIYIIYMQRSGETERGPDRLGSRVLGPGENLVVRNLAAGNYNVIFQQQDESECIQRNVAVNRDARQTITDASLAACFGSSGGGDSAAGSLSYTFVNNSETTVTQIYVAPNSEPDWGRDRLGARILSPNGNLVVSNLAAGPIDIKLVLEGGQTCIRRRVPFTSSARETITNADIDRCLGATAAGTARFALTNNGSETIFRLFMRPANASDWGEDRFGPSTLEAGQTFTVRNLAPGAYDVRLVMTDERECIRRNVNVTNNATMAVSAEELNRCFTESQAGEPGTVAYNIVNNSTTTIRELYMRAPGTADWGPDRLGPRTIGAGQTFAVRNLAPGAYELKLVEQDSDECVYRSVTVDGDSRLTVTNETIVRCQNQGGMAAP